MRVVSTFFTLAAVALLSLQPVEANQKHHGLARLKDLKYPQNFTHFDYVNPDAPKGGTLRLGVVGTFDTTNPFLTKGTAPVGLSRFSERLVFESLMKRASDEPFSVYGWIAETVEIAPDNSWIQFNLNPNAKWEDDTPITPDDVIFTHQVFKRHGAPNFRKLHEKVKKIEQVGERGVKVTFKLQEDGTYNPELPYVMAMSTVLPKKYFSGKDFENASLDFIPGSGAYEIIEVKPGHRIVYERRKNYWAKDLNVMKGMANFDRVTVDYYRDPNVARMAFLAGEFDYLAESKPDHQIELRKKAGNPNAKFEIMEYDHERSVPFSTFCMNSRKELFQDVRVRRAMALAFQAKQINETLYRGEQKRNRSFFENTDLAAQGLPTEKEFELLNSFKGDIPQSVFYKAYNPPNSLPDTRSFRENMKEAANLLRDSGFVIKGNRLVHGKTGEPFEFELMLYNKESEKLALAYARTLKNLGIHMKIRTLDAAQYEMRRLKFDFDMIMQAWFAGVSPGNELSFYWSSEMANQEGSRNYPGVQSKAVDYLCEVIANAQNRDQMRTACHALDRVLMWGEYVVPLFYNNRVFVAYNKTLGHPEVNPVVPTLLATWWKKENP